MKLKYNKTILLFLALAIVSAFFIYATSAYAVSPLEGLKQAAGKAFTGQNNPMSDSDPNYITSIPSAIGKVVGAGLALIGVIFLILMIYGGFLWMLARGNEQQVTKAKDLILAAIIGLLIVLSAYAITAYVGGSLTN